MTNEADRMAKEEEEDSSDDGSASGEDGADDDDEELILLLQARLQTCGGRDYDAHVQLIKCLKDHGELKKLETARQAFSGIFPLTEDMWLGWISDEGRLAVSDTEHAKITSLYERSIADYETPKLWEHYMASVTFFVLPLQYRVHLPIQSGAFSGVEHVRACVRACVVCVRACVCARAQEVWFVYLPVCLSACLSVFVSLVCLSVCLSERKRKTGRERNIVCVGIVSAGVSVYVCESV